MTPFQWERALNDAVDWVNQPHRALLMDQLNPPRVVIKAMRKMAEALRYGMGPAAFAWELEAVVRERKLRRRR